MMPSTAVNGLMLQPPGHTGQGQPPHCEQVRKQAQRGEGTAQGHTAGIGQGQGSGAGSALAAVAGGGGGGVSTFPSVHTQGCCVLCAGHTGIWLSVSAAGWPAGVSRASSPTAPALSHPVVC